MFELVKRQVLEEYEGEGFLYRHRETKMEVFHLKNKDTELSCNFMFNTPSEDDKGIAHIIEHTVLCGSKRFPVKDPFSQAILSSPNTFLNAMTFSDKTMYPLASPLKKDFDNLFDIYADAVFAPLLRRESFMQEGIRNIETFDGIVFNEMCGSRSTEDAIVQAYSTKALFEGTPAQYESGGVPLAIADLTYEEYLERYKKWYSPSNCRLFMFGDLDIEEYLNKLEKRYLEDVQRGLTIVEDFNNYKKEKPKAFRTKAYCPTKNANTILLTWLTQPASDPFERLTLNLLVSILLGNPGAPLYKAIIESGLGEDLSPQSGMDPDYPIMPFSVGFCGAKKGHEDEIEEFLLKTLKDFVEKGIPEAAISSAMKRQEFKLLEVKSSDYPYGIATAIGVSRVWLRGVDPFEGLKNKELFEKLKNEVEKGHYFENWIQKNLLNNQCRCLLTVETDEDYDKNQKALLEEKFKSLEQCPQKYIKAYENFLSTPDTPENLATIGRITLADLPVKVEDYKCDKKVLDNGTTLVSYPVSTKGIVYVHMAIDVKNLCLEDRILLPVLIRLIQMCGTKTMDYSTLSNRIRFLTGGFIIYQNYGLNVHKKVVSQIIIRTKMLQSDFEEGLSLIKDLFLNGDFSDSGRIKASITDIITEFESNYLYSGNAYGSISATATLSSTMYDSEITMGTSSWLKAEEIKKELGDDEKKWVAFGKTLEKLRNKVFTSKALLFHLGCSKETVKDNENIAINFSKAFPVGKAIRTNVFFKNLPNLPKERVYTVSSSPAFNVLAIKLDNMTEKQKVQGTLLSSILSYGWLWNEVRGKGGAYGVEANYGNKESIFVMSSYRDPSISETYKTYKKALKSQFTKEEMEYAVVTMIGKELKPLTTQGKCSESFSRYVYGNSTAMYLRRRRLLLKVTLKDLESIGRIISKAIDEGKYAKVTVCGKDMLKEDKDKVFIAHSRALPI